jgi:hypothetical protein
MADDLTIRVKLDVNEAKGQAKKLGDTIDRSMKGSESQTKQVVDTYTNGMKEGEKKTRESAGSAKKLGGETKKAADAAKPLHERMSGLAEKINAIRGGVGLSGLAGALKAAGPAGMVASAALQAAKAVAPSTMEMMGRAPDKLLHSLTGAIGLRGTEAQSEGRMKAEDVMASMASQYAAAGVPLSDQEIKSLMKVIAVNTQRGAEAAQRVKDLSIQEWGYFGVSGGQ